MAPPLLKQSTGSPQLYWLADATWAPAGAFGLVLFPSTSGAPASFSLTQSFVDYPGCYVTVANKPATSDEPAYVVAVLALLVRLGPGARFVWMDQAVPDSAWARRVLYVQQVPGAAQGLIDRPTVFTFGAYRFAVSSGQSVTPSADGFAITGTLRPAFQLLTDSKTWPLTPTAASATVLSASGATAGTFMLDFTLEASANAGAVSDYELLDIGFRFGLPDPTDSKGILLTSLRYPLFRGRASAPVPMLARLDPAGALQPARTRLAYVGTDAAQATHYISQLGYAVTLAPNGVDSAGLPAGFAFHRRPGAVSDVAQDDPLYLAPIGPFLMNVATPPMQSALPAARLTGGVSGLEYFGFSTGTAIPVNFAPSQAAFAPNFPPPSLTSQSQGSNPGSHTVEAGETLTTRATTAFAALGPPTGGSAWYFAQPDDGAFFKVADSQEVSQRAYLNFLELVTSDVTAPGAAYPMVPYAGVQGNDLVLSRALEMQVLSPMRCAALVGTASRLTIEPMQAALQDGTTQAVTPQGILGSFKAGAWASITLCPARDGTVLPQLAFNTPSTTFHSALQSNQLFMVATDGALLMQNSEFNYWITPAVLGDLARLSGAEAVPTPVITLLGTSATTPQTNRAAFTSLLNGVLTGTNAQYIPTVTKYAVYFELNVEGWRFRLAPSLWADQSTHPPVMIFKYAQGSLYDLVQNTDAWAWSDVARLGGSLSTTQTLINGIITAARAEVASLGAASDLDHFVTEVVGNPGWTGVVVLNANVPFSSVPAELSGLAAGVDPSRFRAHHVGLSVTPIVVDTTARTLAQGASAIFGLIDYEDLADIAHIDDAFDFKVLLLRVLFVNSAITNFAGRIELFINLLFGEQVTLFNSDHYNNLILDGTYQRQGGTGHYVFRSSAANIYGANAANTAGGQVVLNQTEFDQAQFLTATQDTAVQTTSKNRFQLQGKLRFDELHGFDAFSFGPAKDVNGLILADGYLVFSGLSIDMDFAPNHPSDKRFTFNLSEISFDPASSRTRPTSFFQRFPLQLGGMIRGAPGQKPKDLGFISLETPLQQPALVGEWFGLAMTLDLGTLGAMSSSAALSAVILAAWSPTPRGHEVNIGLKLPGLESARSLSPIEGVIDLGFQSIDLQAQGAGNNPPDPAYTLRFLNFYLRFLGWKFPPGQNVITLFGNPDVASQSLGTDRGALGWYAAYAKKD